MSPEVKGAAPEEQSLEKGYPFLGAVLGNPLLPQN